MELLDFSSDIRLSYWVYLAPSISPQELGLGGQLLHSSRDIFQIILFLIMLSGQDYFYLIAHFKLLQIQIINIQNNIIFDQQHHLGNNLLQNSNNCNSPLSIPFTFPMRNKQQNWYIEYDYKTLTILHNPKFSTLIFKQVQPFSQNQGPSQSTLQQQQQPIPPPWLVEIAQALVQILILLFNFFNVQYKLSKNQSVKTRFNTICSVLKIENEYCKYFNRMSLQFRVNRILASSMRLNRFMSCILEELSALKKHMDQTLIDNLNQVYLFMQQRLRETLEVTQTQGDNDLNIIMLDMISLLLRNSGDPSMKGILDINKQNTIISNILKSNEIYDEFMTNKNIYKQNFQENRYFVKENQIEEDPKAKKYTQENEEDEEDFD